MNRKYYFFFKILAFFLVGFPLLVVLPKLAFSAEPIIVDHNCTDISQIPAYWLEQAKQLTIHYAHTSHGSQINTGILNLESQDYTYSVAIRTSTSAGLPPQEDLPALRMYDGNPPETYISPDDYWYGESGRNRTQAVADTGDYGFSMWSWCGQVSSAIQSYIQNYLDTMNQFETEYPSMRFIYMTGHLNGSGSSGNLHVRNEQIRNYCSANNKVLFDFADIERYDPDGTDYLDLGANDNCDYSGGNWANEWCAANPASGLCESCSCAHSKALNCNQKARAFWWMMARLAGWNPDGGPVANFSGTPTTGTAPLHVSFTDSSTGDIESLSWSFGDGGTSTAQNPTHTYDDPGTYNVSLTVTGSGGSDTEIKSTYITASAPLTQYSLTVNIVGQGSVTLNPPGGTYDVGTIVQLQAVIDAGWKFSEWSGALTGSTNPTTITMDADKTVTATFTELPPNQYSLTVNISGNGSVALSPPGGNYEAGTVVQLKAVPGGGGGKEGMLTRWSGCLSGSDNPETITMDSDKTVTATFIEIGVEGGDLTSMSYVDPDSIEDSQGKPDDFPYGLIKMEIEVINAGDQTIVTIYLPKVAPADYKWYKYTSTGDWINFDRDVISNGGGDGAVFNTDRTEVTIYITDNGQYDDDPTPLVIRDPSGLGLPASNGGVGSSSSGGGGCFIGTGSD